MKLKNNYMYQTFKQSLSTEKFILVFSFSILLSLYGVLALAYKDIWVIGFLNILLNPIYLMSIILITFMNTGNILNIFEKNQFHIIRFSSKKKHLIELIKNVAFSNLFILVLNIVFIMIGLNIFNGHGIGISYKGYEISNTIYLLFTIIKFIVLLELLSIINVLLLKIVNPKLMAILNIFLGFSIWQIPSYHGIVSSILHLPIFIGTYLRHQLYSNFTFEVLCFLLYSTLLYIIIFILKKIILKYMKAVVE